jgi:3-oxoacyl-[acyl-carrier-protein] synthase-3
MAMRFFPLLFLTLWCISSTGICLAADQEPDRPRGTIAFASQAPRGWDIYVTNVKTHKTTKLTDHPALDYNAAVSPDGKRVAFVSERDGNMEIYSMNPDGSDPQRLTKDFGLDDHPSWSPDGKQLVFTSTRQPSGKPGQSSPPTPSAILAQCGARDPPEPAPLFLPFLSLWIPQRSGVAPPLGVFCMLPVTIAGLGAYLPSRSVSNAELERELSLPAGWIERTTGVRERRRAESETTVSMAVAAARQALAHADVAPEQIDLVIGASTGPQQLIPCTAVFVQQQLGLPEGSSCCFDLNATCLSFLFALHTAAQLVAAGQYRCVLIFSSELTRRTLDAREPESASLIGDAAAAAVVVPSGPQSNGSGVWLARFATHSSGARLVECPGGGTLHHPNDPATTPPMNTFHMDGPGVFKMAVRLIAPFLDRFFAELGWERTAIDVVVPHQASGRGLDQLSSRLGFRAEQVYRNLATRGNCIAASIPLALAEAVHSGQIRRGQRVLLVGTAAGLTLGAMALTF